MDIIRSSLSMEGERAQWFDIIVSMLTHEKINDIWDSNHPYAEESDANNSRIGKFYINDNVYLTIKYQPNNIDQSQSIFYISITAYNIERVLINNNFLSNHKATFVIYRQGSCIGFNFHVVTIHINSYPLDIPVVIDTINNSNDIAIFCTNNNSADILTSISQAYANNYYLYFNNNFSNSTNAIQLAPFILSKIDAKCDTLYGVCISPVMNRFIKFNNEDWLLFNGLALPCKDEINYYYVSEI